MLECPDFQSTWPDVAVIEMALNETYSALQRMVSIGPSVCTRIITWVDKVQILFIEDSRWEIKYGKYVSLKMDQLGLGLAA